MTSPLPQWDEDYRPLLWGTFNGLAYVPRLPPTGYTLFLHLLTKQEPGGLVKATHGKLAEELAIDRGLISRAMHHLVAARLVTSTSRGQCQLHPQIAAFDNARDQARAIKALAPGERLDEGNFEDEYERRLEAHEQERLRKAEQRQRVTPLRPRLVR